MKNLPFFSPCCEETREPLASLPSKKSASTFSFSSEIQHTNTVMLHVQRITTMTVIYLSTLTEGRPLQ